MSKITENIQMIRASLPQQVTLIAVSKFHTVDALTEAYGAGQRIFGESRAQELVAKQKVLPTDIEWHFIGTLQTNKVKDIAPFIHTIHSIDSFRLLEDVNRQAVKHNRIIRILLEIHIAQEETKHGMTPEECHSMLSCDLSDFKNISIGGLMGMASLTNDMNRVRSEFRKLAILFRELKAQYFQDKPDFKDLSMGMSHDYNIAIEEGSTMVRIGTNIFGIRQQ